MVCFRRGYAYSVRLHYPCDNGLFERVFDELRFARRSAQNQAGLVFARAGLPAFVFRQAHYGRPLRASYNRHSGGADNPAFVRLRDDSQPVQVIGALSFLAYMCLTKGEIVFLLVFIAAVPFCIIPVQMMRRNLKRCAKMSAESLGGNSPVLQRKPRRRARSPRVQPPRAAEKEVLEYERELPETCA